MNNSILVLPPTLTMEPVPQQTAAPVPSQQVATPRPTGEAEQRTDDWRTERLGHVTASRASDLLSEPRSKADREAGLLSASAYSYFLELLAEHLTGTPTPSPTTWAMEHGNTWEDWARRIYTEVTGRKVQTCGFIEHQFVTGAGCSPDGLVGDAGLIEIKCPYTYREHLRSLVVGTVEKAYMAQMQFQLWITGREWCDFVSYDPRQERPEIAFCCVRVERDSKLIDAIERGTRRILDKLAGVLKDLDKRCKPITSEIHQEAHAIAIVEAEPEPTITLGGVAIHSHPSGGVAVTEPKPGEFPPGMSPF